MTLMGLRRKYNHQIRRPRNLGYDRKSETKTAWRLHLVHNPLEGRYEKKHIFHEIEMHLLV